MYFNFLPNLRPAVWLIVPITNQLSAGRVLGFAQAVWPTHDASVHLPIAVPTPFRATSQFAPRKNLTVVLTTDLPERSARLQPEQPVVIRLQRVQKIRCRSQTEFFHDGRRTEADRGGEADGRRGRDQTGLGKLQSPALRSGDRQAPRAPDR